MGAQVFEIIFLNLYKIFVIFSGDIMELICKYDLERKVTIILVKLIINMKCKNINPTKPIKYTKY